MKALHNEKLAYLAVLAGELEIDAAGRIWRLKARRGVKGCPGEAKAIPCKRRRAENSTGKYLQVRTMIDGKRIHVLAHRLVWFHFYGEIPAGLTVNHKRGNPMNNHPMGLELATYAENCQHAVRILGRGRAANQDGEKNHAAKLTAIQVAEIRRRRKSGKSLNSLAISFGVRFQTISKIARGERWAKSLG